LKHDVMTYFWKILCNELDIEGSTLSYYIYNIGIKFSLYDRVSFYNQLKTIFYIPKYLSPHESNSSHLQCTQRVISSL